MNKVPYCTIFVSYTVNTFILTIDLIYSIIYSQKTSHFEAELYKALDLAHDYQEKCKQLTAEKKELEERMKKTAEDRDDIITKKDKEIETLKENCETIMRLNKQSTDCVKNLEDALEKVSLKHTMYNYKRIRS